MTGYVADDVRDQLRQRRAKRDAEMDRERAEGVREPKESPAANEPVKASDSEKKKESSVPAHLLDRSKMAGEDLERFMSGRFS